MPRYDPIGWIDGLTNNFKKQKEQLEKELEKVESINYKEIVYQLELRVEEAYKVIDANTNSMIIQNDKVNELQRENESLKAQLVNMRPHYQHLQEQEVLMDFSNFAFKREHEKRNGLIEGLFYIKGYAQGINNKIISDFVDAILEENK